METRDYEMMEQVVKPLEWQAKKGRKWEASTPFLVYQVREAEGMFSMNIGGYEVPGLRDSLADAKAFCWDDLLGRMFNTMGEDALAAMRERFTPETETPSLS